MNDFVHLHLHSQYSLLDGAASIDRVMERALELGMKSVAITDHGVMYGAIEFYCAAKSRGLKPIIGCEVYTAPRKLTDKDVNLDKRYGHLVLLCQNEVGYRNLMDMVTKSHVDGFYYRPRVDMELLETHSEGLIALSACLRGDVPSAYLNGGYDSALAKAREYERIFGKGNFFLEIQDHGIEEEKQVKEALIRISEQTGIGLVATNDVHYTYREEALLQDVLTCIQTGKTLSDTDRMKMIGEEFYFKSGSEMAELFSDCPSAVENTLKIADRCNLTIDMDSLHLPSIYIDTSLSHRDYLRELCVSGMLQKYGGETTELIDRLDYELGIINSMGYTDYFLIVYDFIKYAKDSGISVGPGRGSAAGSLVSYCLNITEVDPIRYNLIFERFLNPERVSMPDIDIDFCYKRRDEVRSYVAQKFGGNRVSQIITFGTLAARAAIKDVGRAMGISLEVTSAVSKAVPRVLNIKLKDALEQSAELKNMYRTNTEVRSLLDIAMKLEGFPRNASTHAAGVVIGDCELTDCVPLQSCETGLLTQYPMADLEKIGMLKMDFLGLRNLTIIDDCIALIKDEYGTEISIEDIDSEDTVTFELICKGETDGVFQLENPGLQTFLRKFRPSKLEDIITTTSIYRPGPMEQIPLFLKNVANHENISYAHPSLEPILKDTYGVVVYQEQVMNIVRSLAGYSMGRADLVRRTMAKKKHDQMLKEREIFLHGLEEDGKIVIEGAVRRGVDEKTANFIFDSLVDFANYAFNKSHAACYALVAYRTAWLKAHYPTCYLASVLKNYAGYMNKAVKYINSFARYGIKVLPPDVNKSFTHFAPEGRDVRYGFCWLKNLGDRFTEQIVKERKLNGNFTSFEDFIKRMSNYDINKRSVDVMIKCGCFDSLYTNRRVLVMNCERLTDSYVGHARTVGSGQLDWFSEYEDMGGEVELFYTDFEDFSHEQKMGFEYEYAGMYFSGHPLDSYRYRVQALSLHSAAQICDTPEDDSYVTTICGRVSQFSSRRTKSGHFMSSFTVSDFSGSCPAIAFESVSARYGKLLFEGSVVCIEGEASCRDAEKGGEFLVHNVKPLAAMKIGPEKSLYIRLKNQSMLDGLKKIITQYPGQSKLCIYFEDSKTMICSDSSRHVNITEDFCTLLAEHIGEENVKIK